MRRGNEELKTLFTSSSHSDSHSHINMCSPSHSPSHQQHQQQQQELDPHPTPTPTPTPTATPHDQIPQTLEPPNQIKPPEIQQQEEEQFSDNSGMSASFPPAPLSIDYPPPITHTHVSNDPDSDATMASPVHPPALKARVYNKRKKGKPNVKKLQAIEKKCQILMEKLNPIPFVASNFLDFSKHERILQKLGLWDSVHIEFDKSVRVDLIAQLVASYDSKGRCSFVNGTKILVNRADLARAFKFPVKKEKGGGGGVELDLEELTEESIGFVEDFVLNWICLHEDTWMMPGEVLSWIKLIKNGHPEKLDWAGLLWFMVEKELTQGEQLTDCYYAYHLQHLIKSQHEEVLLKGEPEKVELDSEVKEEDCSGNDGDLNVGDVNEVQEEECVASERLNIELTLGQDGGEKEQVKDVKMMDVEEGNEDEEDEEQEKCVLVGKISVGDQFLQRCNLEESRRLDNYEDTKEENEEIEEEKGEEEAEDGFDVAPSEDTFEGDDTLEGDGLTGNLLQAMETSQMAFTSQEQFHDQSSMELLASTSDMQHANPAGPSYYENGGKRVLGHEHDISHQSLNGRNKRLRIDGEWDDKPSDFGTCMEQIQLLMTRATMMYETKEQSEEQLNMHQQMLFNELQKRDSMIEHLHKIKCEEIQRRDEDIFRLERELYVMGNLVEGYRKSLKETQKAFAEYRQRSELHEEPIYKDAGPGGIMLSDAEIERQRLKQEEEHRLNCLMLEQKAKEVEEGYASQFRAYLEDVHMLDKRLVDLENCVKQLKESWGNRKVSEAEQQDSENPECPANE